jgi:hypothetical protein
MALESPAGGVLKSDKRENGITRPVPVNFKLLAVFSKKWAMLS